MKRHNSPWQPMVAGAVEWTEEGAPHSIYFDDVYYSSDNAIEESEFVFLQGNQLPARWQNWNRKRFCIAETGFGTGLNFLLTWQAWRAAQEPRPDLHYLSIEKYPLSAEDMTRALAAWPALRPLARQLLAQYPGLAPGQHRLLLEQGKVTLDLWWEDVADALPDLASHLNPGVDAWYLDGFSPARNATIWHSDVLDAVASLSRPNASFSTFTAAVHVGRQLQQAGFTVDKVPGYGSKRECLRGRRTEQPSPLRPAVTETPWDVPDTFNSAPKHALVVGAGLAGCAAAAALARRGIEVTLLEQGQLAAQGSGNDQGILYTRMSREHSALVDFSLQSFLHASTLYSDMFAAGILTEGLDGALCGTFQQDERVNAMLAETLASVPELAQVLSAGEAQELLGIAQPAPGYWFPRSGWLHPGAICRVMANQDGVLLREQCGEIGLSQTAEGWRATDQAGRYWEAPCAVIAAGTGSSRVAGLDWLPLQAIRGQTTQLSTDGTLSRLQAVLCHEGYIAPARLGSHCIGATFDLDDRDPELRPDGHDSNLASLASAVPAWREALQLQDTAALAGRVGFRCASPDYLPLAGPVPDRQAFVQRFDGLRSNARKIIDLHGKYLPGLFLSTGHGSRGLSSTPLAAELLASQICGEPPPLSRELIRALAPARFIIRDLRRNRI
jgi:tRNA 5-methylaminomethyl-2-thiouridine biosynthesis bifunctional protein